MFFFFKQKTAYEFLSGLVGSEMCLTDSYQCGAAVVGVQHAAAAVVSSVIFECAVCRRGAAAVVVHPAAVVGSVARECTVCQHGATVIVVAHPAASLFFITSVIFKCTVCQRGAASKVEHSASRIADNHAICECWATQKIAVDTSSITRIVYKRTINQLRAAC